MSASPDSKRKVKTKKGDLRAAVLKMWRSFLHFNYKFIRRRAGLVYSLLWFFVVGAIYLFGIKLDDHLSDEEFVKHHIERSAPVVQLNTISKLIRGEEFDIEEGLLVKSYKVKPKRMEEAGGFGFFRFGRRYGFEYGGGLFLFNESDGEWQKFDIPIEPMKEVNSDEFRIIPDASELRIHYDISTIKLFHNESQLAFWHDTQINPIVLHYNAEDFVRLAGDDGSNRIYFLGDSLASLTEDGSLLMIPLTRSGEKLRKGVREISMPSGAMDYQPHSGGLVIHSLANGRHSFHYKGPGKNDKLIPDSLAQAYCKEDIVDWKIEQRIMTIYDRLSQQLAVIDISDHTSRLYHNKGANFFRENPLALSIKRDVIWLAGPTFDGYGVAKLSLKDKIDSLTILQIPQDEGEDRYPPQVNLSYDGLALVLNSFTGYMGDYKFLRIQNSGLSLDTLKTLEPWLIKSLEAYDVFVPTYSSKLELAATSWRGVGASFQIVPKTENQELEVVTVQNNKSSSPQPIKWPESKSFDVAVTYDYFFAVILIIGCILGYFFGLFYILDFKNRDKPLMPEGSERHNDLLTLKEKVQYARNSMGSLKLRSEIMLWLGIIIGVAGMLAFVFSLKTFFEDTKALNFSPEFVVRLLRTFGIFAFMEIFSFYFLKQYRIIFNEYKRFFSLYLRLMNYYQYIEIIEKYPEDPAKSAIFKELRDAVLKESINMHDDSLVEKINEFERSTASDLLKTLADKIPNKA